MLGVLHNVYMLLYSEQLFSSSEKLNDRHPDRIRFFLSKADTAGVESDRQVGIGTKRRKFSFRDDCTGKQTVMRGSREELVSV